MLLPPGGFTVRNTKQFDTCHERQKMLGIFCCVELPRTPPRDPSMTVQHSPAPIWNSPALSREFSGTPGTVSFFRGSQTRLEQPFFLRLSSLKAYFLNRWFFAPDGQLCVLIFFLGQTFLRHVSHHVSPRVPAAHPEAPIFRHVSAPHSSAHVHPGDFLAGVPRPD